ncbi:MAG: phosphoserine phosphatase SerB [Alphaproteobacteria bacterium]|nr:phosphoserine phosphatase SerB [Alphaproteobacteria bacterium]
MAASVLTLIAAEAEADTEPWADAAARALERLGAQLDATERLAPRHAVDIPFDGLDPDQAEAAVRAGLKLGFDGPPVDALAQPAAGRRKRLLLSDMESTVIANEMLVEIAALAGIEKPIAEITRRAMNDEIDFTTALKERVALLRDRPAALLDRAARRIRITAGAAAMVATMRKHGALAVLISGGFTVFTDPVACTLGFDRAVANRLLVEDGKIAGVAEPILTRDSKLATLTRMAAEHSLKLAETLAIGDGANDLPMIGAAGLGIAFHSHPNVAPRARHRIDHADLTAALYAQGYRRDEIVGG